MWGTQAPYGRSLWERGSSIGGSSWTCTCAKIKRATSRVYTHTHIRPRSTLTQRWFTPTRTTRWSNAAGHISNNPAQNSLWTCHRYCWRLHLNSLKARILFKPSVYGHILHSSSFMPYARSTRFPLISCLWREWRRAGGGEVIVVNGFRRTFLASPWQCGRPQRC